MCGLCKDTMHYSQDDDDIIIPHKFQMLEKLVEKYPEKL